MRHTKGDFLHLHLMSRCKIAKRDDLHKYNVPSTCTREFWECFMGSQQVAIPRPLPLPLVSSSNYCALNPVTLQSTISKHHC
jgi:hypothetical protein